MAQKTKNYRILIIDDEINIRHGIADALTQSGYTTEEASDGAEAIRKLRKSSTVYDVVVTDLRMPGGLDGLELVQEIKETSPDAAIIVITAYGTIDSAVRAMKVGAEDYITKPIDLDHLEHVVGKALERTELLAENRRLKERLIDKRYFDDIIGDSLEMRRIYETVDQVAASDVTVLIQGESGVGKELIARSIHLRSNRSNGPFITVNCGALPDTLFHSEIFGHETGAFTGALKQKKGRFELADGGTLFLDEVAEMPFKHQVDFLRVLQNNELRRVGGEQVIKVDVRVIAATNQNIEERVARGDFRDDLYYRLNVVPITIPPLRRRKDDIPLLVEAFLEELAEKHRRSRMAISPEAVKVLTDFSWPGNVRQLRNAIERLTVTTQSDTIRPKHLPDDITAEALPDAQDQSSSSLELKSVTKDAERLAILQALDASSGHRERAAKLLDISVRSLRYKMKEYGIK